MIEPKISSFTTHMADYQGWTNRATWAVNLWLNNDDTLYTNLLDIMASNPDGNEDAANALKEYVVKNIWAFKDTAISELPSIDWVQLAEDNREN